MKARILGLVAAGLLGGPMAANAVSLSMQPGSGVDIDNLVVGQQFEIVVNVIGGASNEFAAGGNGGGTFSSDGSPYLAFFSAAIGPNFLSTPWDSLPTLFVLTFDAIAVGSGFVATTGSCLSSNLQDYGCNFDSGPLAFTVTDGTRVPEPGSLALLGLGLAGLGLSRRRKA